MLYIDDFNKAFYNSKAIAKCEDEIEELEIKKNIAKGLGAKKSIEAKIDILKYQASIMNGNLLEVEDFIKNIDNSYIGHIFYRRFLKGESWAKVSLSCSGGCVTNDAIRKIVSRYFKAKGVTKCPAKGQQYTQAAKAKEQTI